jgi:hypothetical protein
MPSEHQAKEFVKLVKEAILNQFDDFSLQALRDEIELELIGRDGYAAGRSAAGWVNMDDRAGIKMLVKGIEDGDPAILDMLPHPDFGGEWADSPRWSDVWASALGIDAEWAAHCHDTEDLESKYREKYDEGVQDELIKAIQGYGISTKQ